MENKMMNSIKNMALGAAIGAAALTAGAVYVSENRNRTEKAMKKVKKTGRKIAKAGESYMRDMME